MASEVAKGLRDRRRLNVWNEAKAIVETAADENREISAEEQGTWEALNEELDNARQADQGRPEDRAAVARTPTRRSTRCPQAEGPGRRSTPESTGKLERRGAGVPARASRARRGRWSSATTRPAARSNLPDPAVRTRRH